MVKRRQAADGGEGRLAIYTGSFDPMTLGHLDVIERASKLFDTLVVGIGESRDKVPLFKTPERLELMRSVCKGLPNVKIESFKGLAFAYAKKRGAIVFVRGLRSLADYNYEMQMGLMNRALAPELETIFIPTSPQFSHISSSLAKEIALYGGDVELLAPPLVARRLREKLAKRG